MIPANKLMHEGFAVGDKIKAHDHPPRTYENRTQERYLIGVVTAVTIRRGANCYQVTVVNDTTFTGRHTRVGETAYVPMEIGGLGEHEGRVTRVG